VYGADPWVKPVLDEPDPYFRAGHNGVVSAFHGAIQAQNALTSHAHVDGQWHAHAHGDYWHAPHVMDEAELYTFDYWAWSKAETEEYMAAHPKEETIAS
jgi:hypothetical protein